ncbi:MAG TPA: dihydrodipicolinate synthase family protein [Roseomonas sp.]
MPKLFHPAEITGILPPLVTPLAEDESIDEKALRAAARFMLGQGVHGLVVGGSSGEGFNLATDELRRLTATVAEEMDDTRPLIAGVIANSTRDAIEKARAVADLGVSALQLTPVHYIYKTDEEAMIRHFRDVYDAAGVPIIVYNVIPWNYLSPKLLLRMMREEPGVIGVKQSAGDLKMLADLLLEAGPNDRIYAAIDALLYPSMALGTHGVISMLASAAPRQCIEMWNAVKAGDHARAQVLHRRMLRLWNAIFADNRIATAKYALSLQGMEVGTCRRPTTPATPAQQAAIRAAVEALQDETVEEAA